MSAPCGKAAAPRVDYAQARDEELGQEDGAREDQDRSRGGSGCCKNGADLGSRLPSFGHALRAMLPDGCGDRATAADRSLASRAAEPGGRLRMPVAVQLLVLFGRSHVRRFDAHQRMLAYGVS